MERQPAACALETSRGVSPTPTVRSAGQSPARSRASSKSSTLSLTLTAESTLPARKQLVEAESFHSRMRNRGWIAGEECASLDGSHCLGRVRRELPVARVGGREQAKVQLGERLAPAREAGVDLRFRNARRSKRTPDVRRCRVARDVGAVGVRPVDGFEREPARLHVHLVVRQEERPVDVEQHEPGQLATTESTASRNVRT